MTNHVKQPNNSESNGNWMRMDWGHIATANPP